MDSDSWISARLSGSSRRYQSRSENCGKVDGDSGFVNFPMIGDELAFDADLYLGGHEEADGDDDLRAEFVCPFCAEDYDVVVLCCHIEEEHPMEAKNGVCPFCGKKVGMDLVGHLTMQHGNILRVQRRRRIRRIGSSSTFSMLRKELREGNLQSLFGGSSYITSSNSEPDQLLSSFINSVAADESISSQRRSSAETTWEKKISEDYASERKPQQSQLSSKDKVEQARRFEFVQGLLMSTILDDNV